MKKILILVAVLAMVSLGASAEKYITVGAIPVLADGVTTFSNNTSQVWVPRIVYTEITGVVTNTQTVSYVPAVTTNASDTGKAYRLAAYTQIGGAETAVFLNSDSPVSLSSTTDGTNVLSVTQTATTKCVLLPGDKLTLTGTQTNLTFNRILFEVK